MADYGAEQIVWVDESSKDERTCIRSYGYGRKGQDADVAAVRGDEYESSPLKSCMRTERHPL
jgi:hypothetical protein